MSRVTVACMLVALTMAPPREARAYTLASAFSDSCHEALTMRAFAAAIEGMPLVDRPVPSGPWEEIAQSMRPLVEERVPELLERFDDDAVTRIALLSFVLGVRAPDTSGHSVTDLNALRRIHADPAAEGQYMHALRGPDDDGLAGDLAAVRGTNARIRERIDGYVRIRSGAPEELFGRRRVFVDYYGRIELDVMENLYVLGEAAHAIQDSHSHTIRDANGDEILHVLNYVEAIGGDLEPAVDGWAHSESMDDCASGEVDLLLERATARTAALASAAEAAAQGDAGPLERGLAACAVAELGRDDCGWVAYRAACEAAIDAGDTAAMAAECCTEENEFCGSPWRAIAAEGSTQAYLAEAFGCGASPRGRRGGLLLGALLCLALLAALAFRRGRGGQTLLAFLIALTLPALAQADDAPAGPAAAAGDADVNARTTPAERRDARAEPAIEPPGDAPPSRAERREARRLARAQYPDETLLGAEIHASILSDAPDTSLLSISFGYAFRAGHRFGPFGLYGVIERNYLVPTEFSFQVDRGLLNIAIGFEYLSLGGRLRHAIAVGTSTLRFDTAFHQRGHTGVFAEVRPVGVRWLVHEHVRVVLDPLIAARPQPVLGSPGINLLQYRAALGVEGVF